MKIFYIISKLTGGGAEHVARKNIEVIAQAAQSEVAYFSMKKYDFLCPLDIKFFSAYNPQNKIGRMWSWKNYCRLKKALRIFEPDIIHIHNYIEFSPAIFKVLGKYKKEKKCKIIMTHHTYNYICTNDSLYNYTKEEICEKCMGKYNCTILKDNCSGSKIVSIAKYIQKNMFKALDKGIIDCHISPSVFLKDKLLKAFPDLKVEVIYNPCLDKIISIEELKKIEKKNKLVFFGRVNREKNIDVFLKAFCETEVDMDFYIIGEGNLSDEIEKNISDKRVYIIRRFLNTSELYNVIKDAKFFVLPSKWYENSPVSIVEAIHLGMIPIVSNIGGMKELAEMFELEDEFNPNNIEEIKRVIINLSSNYENRIRKLQENYHKLEMFNASSYYDQIIKIYKEQGDQACF